MTESFDKRLAGVESGLADFRDDTDEIRLSEITERIQEVIHKLEDVDVRFQSLENQTKATRRLTIAIGAAVALILLGELLR